jgi:RNA polymerase sigma-B factor
MFTADMSEVMEKVAGRAAPEWAASAALFAELTLTPRGSAQYQELRNTLVALNMGLVKFAARRLQSRSEPQEDICQVGTIGLIKAIERFDVQRGTRFPTFALPTIRGEMLRFLRDTSWEVHVPRRLQERRLHLAKTGDQLQQALGCEPTTRELAAALCWSTAEVEEAQLASEAYRTWSTDIPREDGGATVPPRADRCAAGQAALERVENLHCLRPLLARLPERARMTLILRFSYDLTQDQIARRLGISQMQVSRVLRRTLDQLRTDLDTET